MCNMMNGTMESLDNISALKVILFLFFQDIKFYGHDSSMIIMDEHSLLKT